MKVKFKISKLHIFILVYFIVSATILTLGYYYYLNQKSEIKENVSKELTSIAELKASEIKTWYKEREADAYVFSQSPGTLISIKNFIENNNSYDYQIIKEKLEIYIKYYNYENILIVDTIGNVLISIDENIKKISYQVKNTLHFKSEPIKSKISDIYFCDYCNCIHFDIITPLVEENNGKFKLLGYSIFRVNPYSYLFPLIKRWPTNSKTAETLIVKREGDSVVFLNPLRHRKFDALNYKVSVTQSNLPAVRAVLGNTGLFEGNDYRDKPVLSYSMVIKDLGWTMVSKVDTSEIYAPIRYRSFSLGVFLILLLSLLGFVVLNIHIADRKTYYKKLFEKEELLNESEQRFKLFLEFAPAAIAVFDRNMDYLAVSKRFIKDYKIIEENIIGRNHYDIFPEMPENIKEIHQKCLNGSVEKCDEDKFLRYDGTIDWVRWEIHPWYEKMGQIGGAILFSELITETKQKELEIKKLNEELEQKINERTAELFDLYNNAPCGYHSLDKNGDFLMVNDTELKLLGYSREEVVGKLNFYDILTDNYKRVFKRNYRNFIEKGFVKDIEYDFVRKDGSIMSVILNASAIYDEQGNYIRSRATIIDHTERKKSEVALLVAHKELEEANKELESFSYSVSHDLRAPLRALDGFAKILMADYADLLDDEGKRLFGIIIESSQKMGKLIDDLLTFARLGKTELHHTYIDMANLANEIILEATSLKNKDNIKTHIGPIPAIWGDLPMLRQVLVNLISNAIKFSSKREISNINISSYTENNHVIYCVEDNGTGFELKYANKLFGVFQRLHNVKDFEGTGVGLAIVKRIIEKHNGSVWASAELNKGATFYFSLPIKS